MTGLIRMNAEQMRRKGLENAEAKRQREKDYINQMEKMSKHDVGGLYDIRAIAKSKQFKEQKIIMTHIKQKKSSLICYRVMECLVKVKNGLII